MQFRFRGAPVGLQARPLTPVILLLSLVIIAVSQSILAIVLLAAVVAVAGYFWWRPPDLDFCVEVLEDGLRVRLVTANRIRYSDITEADFRRWEHRGIVRFLRNCVLAISNFFGASWELEGRKGEVDRNSVMVRFRRTILVWMPFPPFVLPKKSWLFIVEDADLLVAEIQKRVNPLPSNYPCVTPPLRYNRRWSLSRRKGGSNGHGEAAGGSP